MNLKKIVILDYNLGNLFSVNQALLNIGLSPIISSQALEISGADAIILPGVGAYKDAMNNLHDMGLVDPIKQFIKTGKPFMGICLGLQLLFSGSEEFGFSGGLGIVPGMVKRFLNLDESGVKYKVPQIAWNEILQANSRTWAGSPLESLEHGENMYFVHSYYVVPNDVNSILSITRYGSQEYVSSILINNIFACQFHPEKSANNGVQIYKTWAEQNNLL